MEFSEQQVIDIKYIEQRFVFAAEITPAAVSPLLGEYERRVQQADAELSEEEIWLGAIGRGPDENMVGILSSYISSSPEKIIELTGTDAEHLGRLIVSKLVLCAHADAITPTTFLNQSAA